MKKLNLSLLALFLSVLLFSSCKENSCCMRSAIQVWPAVLEFAAAGDDEQTFSVTSNMSWRLLSPSVLPSWLEMDLPAIVSGSMRDIPVKVSASNATENELVCEIIFIAANGDRATLTLKQPAYVPDDDGGDDDDDDDDGDDDDDFVKLSELIPAGTFWMGSPTTELNRYNYYPGNTLVVETEEQHQVALTKGFYMGVYTITNSQYAAFLNAHNESDPGNIITEVENAYCSTTPNVINTTWFSLLATTGIDYVDGKWQAREGLENFPMVNVSWYGAQAFCSWLSTKEGKTYRLPTEAEWEYACRGVGDDPDNRETAPFGIGDGSILYSEMANFNGIYPYGSSGYINGFSGDSEHLSTYLEDVAEVGSYGEDYKNGFGLYDMHGNVREWCSDFYAENYGGFNSSGATSNPLGGSGYAGDPKVLRGGNWYDNAVYCRSASRMGLQQGFRDKGIGFRIVLEEED